MSHCLSFFHAFLVIVVVFIPPLHSVWIPPSICSYIVSAQQAFQQPGDLGIENKNSSDPVPAPRGLAVKLKERWHIHSWAAEAQCVCPAACRTSPLGY